GRTTAAVTTASRPGSGEELTINARPAITPEVSTPIPTAGPHRPTPRRPFFVAPHAVRLLLFVMTVPLIQAGPVRCLPPHRMYSTLYRQAHFTFPGLQPHPATAKSVTARCGGGAPPGSPP